MLSSAAERIKFLPLFQCQSDYGRVTAAHYCATVP